METQRKRWKSVAMNSLVNVKNLIYEIRGYKVMLDSDLASLYEVSTKRLNEAVKRNSTRFPAHYMFKLTKDEYEILRSQFATSSKGHGGRRYMPYVFTNNGWGHSFSISLSWGAREGTKKGNDKQTSW